MEYERNIQLLIHRDIIWRRDPITDIPTEIYDWGWFYRDGTHECYTLFTSRAKINTYKSLKWHLYVLWYLNPQLDQTDFDDVVNVICNRVNGYVT